jgi:hypothetical protein
MPGSPPKVSRRFGEIYRLHRQGRRVKTKQETSMKQATTILEDITSQSPL